MPSYFAGMWRKGWHLSLSLYLLFVCHGMASVSVTPYFERVLEKELPGARILSLAEDRWGVLWVGTSNGLARVVGDQVRVWRHVVADSTTLSANQILSVEASDTSAVWVGTVRGLCSLDPISGSVTRHPLVLDGARTGHEREIWQVVRGEGEVLWVSMDIGLLCYHTRKNCWTWPGVEQEGHPGQPFKGVPNAMVWDGVQRVLWAGTKNGLHRIPSNVSVQGPLCERSAPYKVATHVSCLYLDQAGRIWMNDAERFALSVLDPRNGDLRQVALPQGMDEGSINRALLVDEQGGIWLAGNDNVLYWRDPRSQHWSPIVHDPRYRWSPTSTAINALLQSRSGVIWVATEEGLLRVVPEHDDQELLLPWNAPQTIQRLERHGHVLHMATTGLGIVRFDLHTLQPLDTLTSNGPAQGIHRPGTMQDMVNDVAVAQERLLIGARTGIRYLPEPLGDSLPGIFPRGARVRYKYVDQLGVDRHGTTWVLTHHHGLWWITANDRVARQWLQPKDQRFGRISAMAIHPRGGVVCGTADGGLFRLDERGLPAGPPMHPDPYGASISALNVDAQEQLWIGMDDGRLELRDATGAHLGQWGEFLGLPGGSIRSIAPAGGAQAWVLADGGISWVVHGSEAARIDLLDHWGRPTAILALEDGSLITACSKALLRTRLPVGSTGARNVRPAIAAVIGGGIHLPAHPFTSSVDVPFDQRSLSVRVSCLGATAPESVLLRYRLGPDRPWIDLGNARSIDLPDLREGNYAIEFSTLNDEAITAKLLLTIHPPWFRSLAALFAAITMLMVTGGALSRAWLSRRLREERERSAREKALLEERIRIAHDLHDDLGSGLAMIAMEGEMARIDEQADARDALRRMSEGTRDITDSMRRIVWALGSGQDTLGDLAAYIRSSAADLMDRADLVLRTEAHTQDPQFRLTADQRRHLLLITKELLLNVVKHAHAKSVRLVLEERRGTLLITVSDDGKGFDIGERMGTGTGTLSIANRVAALGGTWNVRSAKGEGTIAEVQVPLSPRPV